MIDTKALREKVLDLAIRGKLVPQDPSDEPASVLLKKIREQKKQMVKEGKLKAKDIKNDTIIFKGDDNLHYEQFADGTVKCIENEIPFEVPEGWQWVRLGTIYEHNTGKALNSSNTEGVMLAYITTSNLYWDRFELDSIKEMPFTSAEIEKCTVKKGDLLVCEGGDIGRSAIWYCDNEVRIQNHIHRLRSYISLSNRFYYYVLYLWKIQKRIGGQGIGLQGLSSKVLHKILVPLPTINEQQNIVDKLDHIFDCISDLDIQKDDFLSLVNLVKSKTLDLAIQGKLVPQDPNDEPASVLLDRIRAEKEELIKAGKIKRDKKESVIFKGDDNSYYEKIGKEVTCIDGEMPFEIPQDWCYTRLSSISEIIMGSSPNGTSINRNGNGIEFHQGKICFTDKIIGHSSSFTDKSVKLAKENSLLLCVRAPVGEVNITDRCVCIGRGLAAISPLSKMQTEFLFYWLQSLKKVLLQKATGSTFVAITADTVKNIYIPLPPLEEQNRICKVIDKIFTILDTIEQSLN